MKLPPLLFLAFCCASRVSSLDSISPPPVLTGKKALDEVFLVGDVYKVGFLTICGNPLQWTDKKIEVTAYAQVGVGGGFLLNLLPVDVNHFPAECTIGVSMGGNVEDSRRIINAIGKAKWALVTVRGDFIVIGPKGLPPHLGSLNNSSVKIHKLAPRE